MIHHFGILGVIMNGLMKFSRRARLEEQISGTESFPSAEPEFPDFERVKNEMRYETLIPTAIHFSFFHNFCNLLSCLPRLIIHPRLTIHLKVNN